MKNKKPRSLIKELAYKHATVREAQDIIDDATSRYKKEISKPKEVIRNCENGIREIKDTTVTVGLETLVEEIAASWGVDENLVDAELQFDSFFDEDPGTFEELVQWFSSPITFKRKNKGVTLYVRYEDENMLKETHVYMPLNNESFKGHEFTTFENLAGKNSFYMSDLLIT